jgi:hypothetical protein
VLRETLAVLAREPRHARLDTLVRRSGAPDA